jgi:hypothetical protein
VVDAAGAIYVIGGGNTGGTDYQDVWVSTNGGARPDSFGGGVGGTLCGTSGVLWGTTGERRGTQGVLRGY